jgi:hypothetical protein
MKRMRLLLLLILTLAPALFSAPALAKSKHVQAAVRILRITYHGWPGSFVMSNGKADVVIVPAVGRVMQFHFADDSDGPLFENRAMDSKTPDPNSKDWGNFGGDKSWPSPQADWGKITGREWPPPVAFDSMPVEAHVASESIDLISSVDPAYGIRETRHLQLERTKPVLIITTTYEKVQGDPVKVGVWVITQLRDPQRAFMVLPAKSQYPEGYNKQMEVLPKDLKVEGRLVSLNRDPKNSAKIGSDAGTLIWMDEKYVVRIDSPRVAKAEYPDQGSSAEIYTNADPLPYIELEMLGPLSPMKVGDRIERTNVYRLMRRKAKEPKAEIKKMGIH